MLICQISDLHIKAPGELCYRTPASRAHPLRSFASANSSALGRYTHLTAPSPAHQVALDLTEDAPAHFVMEPPGYQLHKWHAESELVSHAAFMANSMGRIRFYDEGELID